MKFLKILFVVGVLALAARQQFENHFIGLELTEHEAKITELQEQIAQQRDEGVKATPTLYDILDNALDDPAVMACLSDRYAGWNNNVDAMYSSVPNLARAKQGEIGKELGYLLDCSIDVRQ